MHFSTHFNALNFYHKRAKQLYSVVLLQRSDNDISLDPLCRNLRPVCSVYLLSKWNYSNY